MFCHLQGQPPSTLNNALLTQYKYVVRIINPEQKSKFVNKIWHDVHSKFEQSTELKMKLVADHADKLPSSDNLRLWLYSQGL